METTYQIRCSLCFFFASPYLLDIHHPYASVCLRCRVPLKEILCISALLQLIQCDRCFSLFFKKPIATFFKNFYSVVAIRKGTSQHGPIGVSAPNRKKNNWRKKWKTNAKNKKLVPERKEEWMNLKWTKKGGSFSIGTCWTFWWEIWLKSATVLSILYYDRCVPPPHYFSIYKIHSTIFLLKEKRKQMRETSLEFFTVSEYTTRRPARFRLANMYNDDDESTTCFGSLLLLLPLWKNKRRGKKKKKNW